MHVDAAQKPSTRIISEGTKGKTEFSVNITHERAKQCNVYTRAERWKTNERSACEMNQSLNRVTVMVKWRIASRRDKLPFFKRNTYTCAHLQGQNCHRFDRYAIFSRDILLENCERLFSLLEIVRTKKNIVIVMIDQFLRT